MWIAPPRPLRQPWPIMANSDPDSPQPRVGRPRKSPAPGKGAALPSGADAGGGVEPTGAAAGGSAGGPTAGSAGGAVDRALAILDALAARDGLTLSELGRRVGLAPSTAHRLLGALAARRLAEADPVTQRWSVGPAAVWLGAAFLRRGGLAERARPALDRLAADSGETAILVVPDAEAALVVAEAAGGSSLRVVLPPGTRLPYHASAAGKALIAHLPLERVRALLGGGALAQLTSRTLTDQGALTADLATLRHTGWLAERDEAAEGQSAIAAPVFGGLDDPIAALSVAGPSQRLHPDAAAALGPAIAAAARRLGAALGGPVG